MQQKIAQKMYSLSFLFTTLTLCLTPLLFLPVLSWGNLGLKFFLFVVGAFLSLIFWVLSQFSEGVITFTRRRALGMLFLWQLVLVVGIFFSENTKLSLWGRGVSQDSFIVLLSFSTLVFLIAQFVEDKRKSLVLFFSFFGTLSFIFLLQIIITSLIGIPSISRIFENVVSSGTIVGSWSDFSYVVLFLYGSALLTYELYTPSRILKRILFSAIILSLVVFLFLNIKIMWLFVLLLTLGVFLYKMVYQVSLTQIEETKNSKIFPTLPFIGVLVSLFFLLSSPIVSGFFARSVGFAFNDVRPSFSITTTVAKKAFIESPLFGTGMGTYSDVWDFYKPIELNTTGFWNTSFSSGFSYLTTVLTTQGILSVIALLMFLISVALLIKRIVTQPASDAYTRWVRALAVFSSLLFIVALAVYTPSITLFVIGAFACGLVIAVSPKKDTDSHCINYLQDPRKSFFAVGSMLIVVIASFGIIFYTVNLFIGTVLYSRAIRSQDTITAINRLGTVVQINQNDLYHRVRASLLLSEFNTITRTENADVVVAQNLYREAVDAALRAYTWHNGSAINSLLVSQIYQAGAAGENTELYEEAKKFADQALAKNPLNPVLELNSAQVALTQKKTDEAYGAIVRAKEKKADYIDAYLLRGQLRKAAGEQNGFITELTAFLEKSPSSADGYSFLSEAYAEQNRYNDALDAILLAQQLDPTNISRFATYIALLEKAGRKDTAILELQAFKNRFPQITGVDERIEELRNTTTAEVLTPEVSLENQETQN